MWHIGYHRRHFKVLYVFSDLQAQHLPHRVVVAKILFGIRLGDNHTSQLLKWCLPIPRYYFKVEDLEKIRAYDRHLLVDSVLPSPHQMVFLSYSHCSFYFRKVLLKQIFKPERRNSVKKYFPLAIIFFDPTSVNPILF